ncbi:protein of unknown function [Candidatus Hydrogenisulfobacillus filiaventi]|uniref:Uncharacterized protein n=1 Tax=Candidatus Hydrogenisulfobacillus filiaventi TaxID=2707344 RepID=A0A6F8ZFF2_9FIRM|nr:hypothetical protein [Bacillota bacterium]CAB1128363.1 protein of unknown function [Candidatus Hydrogenisulfobacillus filiaventi]
MPDVTRPSRSREPENLSVALFEINADSAFRDHRREVLDSSLGLVEEDAPLHPPRRRPVH